MILSTRFAIIVCLTGVIGLFGLYFSGAVLNSYTVLFLSMLVFAINMGIFIEKINHVVADYLALISLGLTASCALFVIFIGGASFLAMCISGLYYFVFTNAVKWHDDEMLTKP